jgi:hypothetical protein
MKQDWHPDELAQHWTLSPEERELLGNKTGATRLSFAVLLKTFQFDGRFPDRREDVAGSLVTHLARQTGVPLAAYSKGDGVSAHNGTSAPKFASTAASAYSARRTSPPWSPG